MTGQWTTLLPTARQLNLPWILIGIIRRTLSQFFSKRYGKKPGIITGCLGTTTAIRQSTISISCSGNKSYRSYRDTAKRSAAKTCRISLCRELQNKAHCAGKEKSMNIRKPVDYSAMYTGLDQALKKGLSQMEIKSQNWNRMIGCLN